MGEQVSLKRCPFCGVKPMVKLTEDNVGLVACPYCGGQMRFYGDEKEAVKLWNNWQGEKIAELEYIKSFIRECDFEAKTCCDQLQCLWTAYCFHHNLDVDTLDYDMDLAELWNIVKKAEIMPDKACWHDSDSFDDFMCVYLV